MDSIQELEAFAKGLATTVEEGVTTTYDPHLDGGAISGDNAAGAGGLPHGDTRFSSEGPEDGRSVEGVGKPSGDVENTGGTPTKAKDGPLSPDDEPVESQMANKPDPMSQRGGSQIMMGRYRKSVLPEGGRMTPGVQAEAQAHQRAVAISQLQKSDDVEVGVGVEPRQPEGTEVYEKATHQVFGDMVHMSNVSDLEVERMQKSSDFYHGPAPQMGVAANLQKSKPCVGGGDHLMSAHLTTCNVCGAGQQLGFGGPGVGLQKSGRGLVRAVERDLDLSKGFVIPSEDE